MTVDRERLATCQCGQLRIACWGEPVRISVCHCLACQRRSGAPFAAQVRFPENQIRITGTAREWTRIADSGDPVEHHFCPECGSTVWYRSRPHAQAIAVPIGAFADPGFPAPWFSVHESRRHPWVSVTGEGIEHSE